MRISSLGIPLERSILLGRMRQKAWTHFASALLLVAFGIQTGQAQNKTDNKFFSLQHFKVEQIDVDDRSPSLPKELVAIAGANRGRGASWIHCITFSPDGKRIAGSGDSNRVVIFEASTLREAASWNPPAWAWLDAPFRRTARS